jgi:hypothetical protein
LKKAKQKGASGKVSKSKTVARTAKPKNDKKQVFKKC